MPRAETFSLGPVSRLLDRYLPKDLGAVIVDPFARNSTRGNITNDLNPDVSADFHMLAEEFVETLDIVADAVLFDPPYSPRQITEVYQEPHHARVCPRNHRPRPGSIYSTVGVW